MTLPTHPQPSPASSVTTGAVGISEGRLLLLVSAVQFVNILDFMMVMPLGPDFAKGLGIPVSSLGLIGGSYTAAAAVAGMAASRFLDRFDRRPALAVTMLGLVIATAMGGFAQGQHSLMAARVLAGMFGGPATALALSIVADVIPKERRGEALGRVMGAFSVAAVLGVPIGLELARLGSWRTPFFAIAGLGFIVAASALLLMPSITLHLQQKNTTPHRPLSVFLGEPAVFLALLSTGSVMLAAFCVTPNLSTYIQHNMGYPRAGLSVLYLAGGSVSFIAMQILGRYVDRLGSPIMSAVGTLMFVSVLALTFLVDHPVLPVMAIFIGLMSAMAFRNLSTSALSSRVPAAHERARFMSIQSAVQHIASASGAMLSSKLLYETTDHRLVGMSRVAGISVSLALLLPLLLFLCEQHVRSREQKVATPAPL